MFFTKTFYSELKLKLNMMKFLKPANIAIYLYKITINFSELSRKRSESVENL